MAQAYRSLRRTPRWTSILSAALLVAALGVSSGCAARRFDALMRSWQGHSLEDLFRTWGPPNYLYADGGGGYVAVYVPSPAPGTRRSGSVSEMLRAAASARVYDAGLTNAWPVHRIFFSDAAGRIVRSQWRGRWECCSS